MVSARQRANSAANGSRSVRVAAALAASGTRGSVTAAITATVIMSPASVATPAILAAADMGSVAEEAAEALAPLGFGRCVSRRLQRLRPALGGQQRRNVGELLRLQREKLVAGLCRLERALR